MNGIRLGLLNCAYAILRGIRVEFENQGVAEVS